MKRAAQVLSQTIRREMETEDQNQRRLACNSQRRHIVQESQSQVILNEVVKLFLVQESTWLQAMSIFLSY
jgi:hypothetical protein